MPGVDKPDINGCGPTHHMACYCREAVFKELDDLYQIHDDYIEVEDWSRIQELREALGLSEAKPIHDCDIPNCDWYE